MKKMLYGLLLMCLAACTNIYSTSNDAKNSSYKQKVRSNEALVQLKTGISAEEKVKFLKQYDKTEVVDKDRQVYLIKDSSIEVTPEAMAELESLPAVQIAEPNFKLRAVDLPQDPYWLKLWGLKNYGQDGPNGIEGVEGADIGVIEAWKKSKGSKEVVVAVIDSGIDYTHPDLAANVWVNAKEKAGVAGVDDDGNGYVDDIHGWDAVSDARDRVYFGQIGDPDPMDDNAHGTHVAGTIGAVGGNGIGVVGINWNVSIMGVKFLNADGSGASADEYRALKYILANKVDVVNGSYGGGAKSKLIESLLAEGIQKGTLFVFAAGNGTSNNDVSPSYPSSYKLENVISVAATDLRDRLADFSNYGQDSVHIAAPGVNITSTIPWKSKDKSGTLITLDEPYASFSGTSMASPHVAGAAALLIAADPSLKGQPKAIKERLLATADFKPHLAGIVSSSGRLNIAKAIANEKQTDSLLVGTWQEVPFVLETPRYAQERLDHSWPISFPDAKAIQVHFKFAQVESGFDVARLYDSKYRPVFNLDGDLYDTWSPIMLGNKAYLKFSNAVVSIDDGAAFANFNSEGVQIDKVRILK